MWLILSACHHFLLQLRCPRGLLWRSWACLCWACCRGVLSPRLHRWGRGPGHWVPGPSRLGHCCSVPPLPQLHQPDNCQKVIQWQWAHGFAGSSQGCCSGSAGGQEYSDQIWLNMCSLKHEVCDIHNIKFVTSQFLLNFKGTWCIMTFNQLYFLKMVNQVSLSHKICSVL